MKKPKFQRLLIDNNLITQEELNQDLSNNNYVRITKAIDEYAKIILNNIINREITLEPLKNFTIKEGNKVRKISEESAEQQIMNIQHNMLYSRYSKLKFGLSNMGAFRRKVA